MNILQSFCENSLGCTSELFPISHFGPMYNGNSFLSIDVGENYNHSLAWARTSRGEGGVWGLAVSFLVTLHNAVSPHHFLGSLGLWDDHGRLMDGKEVEVSMSAQVPHDHLLPQKKTKEMEIFLL